MLLVRGGQFFHAVVETRSLLRQFRHTRFGSRDFFLSVGQAILQILMIRLRCGQFLLRAGVGGRERGDDRLQAADFFHQRELLLRAFLGCSGGRCGFFFLFDGSGHRLLQVRFGQCQLFRHFLVLRLHGFELLLCRGSEFFEIFGALLGGEDFGLPLFEFIFCHPHLFAQPA